MKNNETATVLLNDDFKTMVQIFERATHTDIKKVDLFTIRTSQNGLIKFDTVAHVFYTDDVVTQGEFENFDRTNQMFIDYRKNILEKNYPIDTIHYSSYKDYENSKKEKNFFHVCNEFSSHVNGLKNSNYSEDDFFQSFISVSLLDYIELGDEFSKEYEKFDNVLSIEIVEDLEEGLTQVNGNITFDGEIIETKKIAFGSMKVTARKIKKIIKEKINELVESEEK